MYLLGLGGVLESCSGMQVLPYCVHKACEFLGAIFKKGNPAFIKYSNRDIALYQH